MFRAGIKVEGLKGLERSLKNMPVEVAQKLVKKATRDAQKDTLQAARDRATSMIGGQMGSLVASKLRLKTNKKVSRGISVGVVIGRDPGFIDVSKQGRRNWIPSAIHYGHTKRGGNGRVAPIPFLSDAARATVKGKVDRFEKTVRKGIKRIWKKQGKK